MSDGPQTQTFLFADLAGYTALTEAHGDEAADHLGEMEHGARPSRPPA
jgi:class 3 adenylate cyclase